METQKLNWYIGTRYVILAKHWIWLPDDGFMGTETCCSIFYNFSHFNNLRILSSVCISWTIKCLPTTTTTTFGDLPKFLTRSSDSKLTRMYYSHESAQSLT